MVAANPCSETLLVPVNGTLQCNSSVQATYTECNATCDSELFELIGSPVHVCQTDGTWSGQQSYCQLRRCSPLSNPTNGYILLPCFQVIGSSCQSRCYDGYEFVNGSDFAICDLNNQSNTQWSELGECVSKYANCLISVYIATDHRLNGCN